MTELAWESPDLQQGRGSGVLGFLNIQALLGVSEELITGPQGEWECEAGNFS